MEVVVKVAKEKNLQPVSSEGDSETEMVERRGKIDTDATAYREKTTKASVKGMAYAQKYTLKCFTTKRSNRQKRKTTHDIEQ